MGSAFQKGGISCKSTDWVMSQSSNCQKSIREVRKRDVRLFNHDYEFYAKAYVALSNVYGTLLSPHLPVKSIKK